MFFCEFTHFLHAPNQMSITVVLKLNGLMDVFLQLYIFLEFAFNFASPGYEYLPNFMFCSQFSQFLIRDNRPHSLLAFTYSKI
jgi:hypothetical protein